MHSELVLEYRHLDEVVSTNDSLREYSPVADVSVLFASFQTRGRGQMGNAWFSNYGENLLFSVLVSPTNLKASDAFVLSQAMALAIKETLATFLSDVHVKWPNDIYCGDSKICGTLIENSLMGKMVGRSVIGSGLNVNQQQFPEGLAAPATSIRLLIGRECSVQDLLHDIMGRFLVYYDDIQQGHYQGVRDKYHSSLYLRGQQCRFMDEEGVFRGYISHVEPDGHIVIVDADAQARRYAFKQVRLLR